jgi:hypothetical protein
MMSTSESGMTFTSRLVSKRSRDPHFRAARWTVSANIAAVVAKLRDLAPYAAIELILPGGSLIAVLLWLYRRQKKTSLSVKPAMGAYTGTQPQPMY